MKKIARFSCLLAGTVMLGGCQSFPLTSWMFKGDRPATPSTQLAGNSIGSLEEGKELLREGNISAAVASLRIARLDRATFADASNALAIAYIGLGRVDLAERYFREAIMAEPDNDKFAANLLRLQNEVLLARSQSAAPATVAAVTPAAPEASPDRLAHGRVERVSRTEVQVRSRVELANAPIAVVAFRDAPAQAEANESPAASAEPGSSYPVRIPLPE